MLEFGIFVYIIIAEILIGFALIKSLIDAPHRIWPPPKKKSWQFYYIWILTYSSIIGLIVLGLLDWDSFIFHNLLWLIIGGLLLIVGLIILIWGMQTLSLYLSQGLKGELITNGPYKFSRNPQYLGIDIAILGYIFTTNSILLMITGAFGIFLFIVTPLVEEPWLREEFGVKFDEYCKKVRRFL